MAGEFIINDQYGKTIISRGIQGPPGPAGVPYTGASQDVDLNTHKLTAQTVSSTGAVLAGGATDDGINKLQVEGNVRIDGNITADNFQGINTGDNVFIGPQSPVVKGFSNIQIDTSNNNISIWIETV